MSLSRCCSFLISIEKIQGTIETRNFTPTPAPVVGKTKPPSAALPNLFSMAFGPNCPLKNLGNVYLFNLLSIPTTVPSLISPSILSLPPHNPPPIHTPKRVTLPSSVKFIILVQDIEDPEATGPEWLWWSLIVSTLAPKVMVHSNNLDPYTLATESPISD
ncbi:hypothetical protein STEG23_033247, partial [Scotinomys teguina]